MVQTVRVMNGLPVGRIVNGTKSPVTRKTSLSTLSLSMLDTRRFSGDLIEVLRSSKVRIIFAMMHLSLELSQN